MHTYRVFKKLLGTVQNQMPLAGNMLLLSIPLKTNQWVKEFSK